MVEKQQREDHREREPDGELVVNRHMSESIQKKKAGNRDGYGRCIVNINGPHEIALLSFELQAALKKWLFMEKGRRYKGPMRQRGHLSRRPALSIDRILFGMLRYFLMRWCNVAE